MAIKRRLYGDRGCYEDSTGKDVECPPELGDTGEKPKATESSLGDCDKMTKTKFDTPASFAARVKRCKESKNKSQQEGLK